MHEHSLSIEDVAREVRISPFHFIRQFEAVFGLTPHQFRIQSRLDRARRLLAIGQHSVTEVCLEVGISSVGSFSDLFTRRVGSTPSAYRRRARALVQVAGALPRFLFPAYLRLMESLPTALTRNRQRRFTKDTARRRARPFPTLRARAAGHSRASGESNRSEVRTSAVQRSNARTSRARHSNP